jgi:hypothetical protein
MKLLCSDLNSAVVTNTAVVTMDTALSLQIALSDTVCGHALAILRCIVD